MKQLTMEDKLAVWKSNKQKNMLKQKQNKVDNQQKEMLMKETIKQKENNVKVAPKPKKEITILKDIELNTSPRSSIASSPMKLMQQETEITAKENKDEELEEQVAYLKFMLDQKEEELNECQDLLGECRTTIEELTEELEQKQTVVDYLSMPPEAKCSESCAQTEEMEELVLIRASNDLMFDQMKQNKKNYDVNVNRMEKEMHESKEHWEGLMAGQLEQQEVMMKTLEKLWKENVELRTQLNKSSQVD